MRNVILFFVVELFFGVSALKLNKVSGCGGCKYAGEDAVIVPGEVPPAGSAPKASSEEFVSLRAEEIAEQVEGLQNRAAAIKKIKQDLDSKENESITLLDERRSLRNKIKEHKATIENIESEIGWAQMGVMAAACEAMGGSPSVLKSLMFAFTAVHASECCLIKEKEKRKDLQNKIKSLEIKQQKITAKIDDIAPEIITLREAVNARDQQYQRDSKSLALKKKERENARWWEKMNPWSEGRRLRKAQKKAWKESRDAEAKAEAAKAAAERKEAEAKAAEAKAAAVATEIVPHDDGSDDESDEGSDDESSEPIEVPVLSVKPAAKGH